MVVPSQRCALAFPFRKMVAFVYWSLSFCHMNVLLIIPAASSGVSCGSRPSIERYEATERFSKEKRRCLVISRFIKFAFVLMISAPSYYIFTLHVAVPIVQLHVAFSLPQHKVRKARLLERTDLGNVGRTTTTTTIITCSNNEQHHE